MLFVELVKTFPVIYYICRSDKIEKYIYYPLYIDFTPPEKGVKIVGYTEQPGISLFEIEIDHCKFEINFDTNFHDYIAIEIYNTNLPPKTLITPLKG